MKETTLLVLGVIATLLIGCNSSDNNGGGAGGNKKGGHAEGVVNGGGGKGVKCEQGDLSSHRILDIYEGEYLYNQTYDELQHLSGDQLFDAMLDRMIDYISLPHENFTLEDRKDMAANLRHYYDGIRFTKKGQSLKATNDADEPLMEDGCELTQIAVYYDESTLLVNKELWDELDEFNQMALVFHEGLYQWQRLEAGADTSSSSRRLVAYLFGDDVMEPLYTEELLNAPASDIGYCFDISDGVSQFAFYVLRQPNGLKIVFDEYMGSSVMFTLEAELGIIAYDDILDVSGDGLTSMGLSSQVGIEGPFNPQEMATMTIVLNDNGGTFSFSVRDRKKGEVSTTMTCSPGPPIWE